MSVVTNLRGFFYGSFMSLPLVLIGITLFLATNLGNIGLLMLSVGHIAVVPLFTFLMNLMFEFTLPTSMLSLVQIKNADICNLVPSFPTTVGGVTTVAPSYWMAHTAFFFVFLMTNALTLYLKPASSSATKSKVENRKAKALNAFITTLVVFVVLVVARNMVTGCETPLGSLLAILSVGSLAYGWYMLSSLCGAKDSDVFGILQKILPPNANTGPPMTCVPLSS